MSRIFRTGGWLVLLAAVAALGVVSAPAHGATRLRGATFGGVTPQDWPVVIQTRRGGRVVSRASIGITTTCTSGKTFNDHDSYVSLRVSRHGIFTSEFGPQDNGSPAPGVTETIEGSIFGQFNHARTKVTGFWKLLFVDTDANGNVVDTCDSGAVRWSAKQ
jgi:hypothetical protein